MSSGKATFLGVLRSGPNGQLLLASVFAQRTPTTDKSVLEHHVVETCSKPQSKCTGFSSKELVKTYNCYIEYDTSLSCFITAAVPQGFSDRLARDILRDAIAEVAKLGTEDIEASHALGLNKRLRAQFRDLLENGNSDELSNAQNKVDEVKSTMVNTMSKVTTNVNRMEDLEAQAQDLACDSRQYQHTMRRYKNQQRAENIKWMLIFGSLVLCTLIGCIFLLAPSGTK